MAIAETFGSLMEDTPLSIEQHDGVALVQMSQGVTNALGPGMVEALSQQILRARDDPATGALVLTSANTKFFSIGLDIPHLWDLPEDEFLAFVAAFSRLCLSLYTLPKPTVAAIPGHATAGGCILALCCDYRFIADGRKLIGLNEIRLGVPVPFLADCILTALVGPFNARQITESGEFFMPERALALGLVDRIIPAEDLTAQSIVQARSLADTPGMAFAQTKANRVRPVCEEIEAGLDAKNLEFVRAWYSPEARSLLREAAAKF
jgi:enoyl-CoA hydratase/carnithine racemase